MAAYSAQIKGAGQIMVVDRHLDRLARNELAKKGELAFDFGELWSKGLRMATRQTSVKAYNRHLCKLIELGKARPSFIVSHELSLEQAPDAYQHFDAREQGWTKVVLRSHATQAKGRAPAHAGHKKSGDHHAHARH